MRAFSILDVCCTPDRDTWVGVLFVEHAHRHDDADEFLDTTRDLHLRAAAGAVLAQDGLLAGTQGLSRFQEAPENLCVEIARLTTRLRGDDSAVIGEFSVDRGIFRRPG